MAIPAQDPLKRRQPEIAQKFVFQASPQTLDRRSPGHQSYVMLRFLFIVLPIIVGVDKFFDVLTGWDAYLSPSVNSAVVLPAHSFMQLAGVIEVVMGFGVALLPRLFGGIFALWLIAIDVNLISLGSRYELVVINLALAVAAVAMGRLGAQFEPVPKRRLQALQ